MSAKQPHLETRSKKLIEENGLQFKDLNGNGRLDPYEDWRLPVEERVRDLVGQMTTDEKIGLMFIRSRTSGYSQKNRSLTSHEGILDEEYKTEDESVFAFVNTPGTTETLERLGLRHFILRENLTPSRIASFINAINEVAENTRLGIPAILASNSRNEKGEEIFGMNDAVGVFTTFPGTLGLAAAAQGAKKRGEDDLEVFRRFAEICRREWLATGLRKGYMYMLDVVTDPRWQRIYGTFGEDTDLIARLAPELIRGFQGESLDEDSVALTIKHFPGGGARENGFDPHYEEGKYNVYVTPGSLAEYHLPPFEAAVEANPASVMPYYSIPSAEKSVEQELDGETIPFEPYGFAFNKPFLQDILRTKYGFKGYINSDSGIINKMSWGVEDLSIPERAAAAVNAGVDVISDSDDVVSLKEAYDKGLVSEERLDQSAERLLTEFFELGLFDSMTYVDTEAAETAVKTEEALAYAREVHDHSLVLLKNRAQVLPLAPEALKTKKVYVEVFANTEEQAAEGTGVVQGMLRDSLSVESVADPADAEILIYILRPQSGDYFSATPGLLELGLVDDAQRTDLAGGSYKETTLKDASRLVSDLKAARERGAETIVSLNFTLPWLVGTIEPYTDVLIASFDAFEDSLFRLISGEVSPKGALPLTLPAGDAVIEVTDGVSVSPNDVPGYAKEQYMPEGMQYAYRDEDGNDYRLGFGLGF